MCKTANAIRKREWHFHVCLPRRTRKDWCVGGECLSPCGFNGDFEAAGPQIRWHSHEQRSVTALVRNKGSSRQRRIVPGWKKPELVDVPGGEWLEIAGQQDQSSAGGLVYGLCRRLKFFRGTKCCARNISRPQRFECAPSLREVSRLSHLLSLRVPERVFKILGTQNKNSGKDRTYDDEKRRQCDPPPTGRGSNRPSLRRVMEDEFGIRQRTQRDSPDIRYRLLMPRTADVVCSSD